MRIWYRRCAGLDVHKASVLACVLVVKEANCVEEEVRRFGTMTEDLKELAAWWKGQAVERVAMESTGVYWKPVWNILEAAELDLLLANAQQVKALPGRKTDQKDSQWLADLLMHGLLKNSFVPSRVIRDLRDLTRSRARLAPWHGTIANRIQKVLEDANIKLSSVASDVLGVSGRLMLQAITQGKTDTSELADLSKGRLREKIPQLRKALEGHVTGHHRWLLSRYGEQFQFLEKQIVKTDAEIARRMKYTPEELAQVKAALPPGTPLPPCPRQAALEYWMELPWDQHGEWLQYRRRDRSRHDAVSQRGPSGELGHAVSGTRRKRRKTAQWSHPQRQPVAAAHHERSGLGRLAHQRHLLCSPVPEDRGAPWQETSQHRGGSQPAGHGLHDVDQSLPLQGSGGFFF